ncbi:MAG: VacJ family lipoprotein [Dongiaceae bacterium]
MPLIKTKKLLLAFSLAWLTFGVLSAPAYAQLPPGNGDSEELAVPVNDPLEGLNRGIFAFNRAVDKVVVRPVSVVYKTVIPRFAQRGVTNFLRNLDHPVIFANNVLQGRVETALNTLFRFVFNSTFGVFGLFDVATEMGMPYKPDDFGQTLATWGVGDGPYLVLPLIGPSNARDGVGRLVDFFADPWRYVADNMDEEELTYIRYGMVTIDARSRNMKAFDDLERNSLDFYATLRSLYKQRRDFILRGKGVNINSSPSTKLDKVDLIESQPKFSALPAEKERALTAWLDKVNLDPVILQKN